MSAADFGDYFNYFENVVMTKLREKYSLFPKKAFQWISEMTQYCVPGGKLNRGRMVVEAVNLGTLQQSEELMKKARCLGWCIEWLQAYFLVADDVMDSSSMRRGQPCRYRQPGVGLIAINDALLLRSSIDLLLESEFNGPKLQALKSLFSEVERDTQMGQLLDLTMNWEELMASSGSSMHKYYQMVQYKTAIYSFYLPFACAAVLLDSTLPAEARDISLQLGTLFQVQDDVLDVFGDPQITGKVGTDIEEGKCTWLFCRLLEKNLANDDHDTLYDSYGKAEGVKSIESVYRKYNLQSDFQAFESELTSSIKHQISLLPSPWSKAVFTRFLSKILNRIK